MGSLQISREQVCQVARTVHLRSAMDEVAGWIYQEMKKNIAGEDATRIREDSTIVLAFHDFYELTRSGGKWDHKKPIVAKFGEWTCDFSPRTAYRYDIWSNVHFGYVGRSVGFSRWTLEAGAGAAQAMAGTVPDGYWSRRFEKLGDADVLSALDDPLDLVAIRLGMDLWDAHGEKLTREQFLAAIRARSKQMATALCQARCKVVLRCPKPIIVLDPGHGKGSMNVGASVVKLDKQGKSQGQDYTRSERDLVMKVSEELKRELEDRGYVVYLTRSGENYVKHFKASPNDLDDRVAFSNAARPDYFMSLHADGEDSGKHSGAHSCYRSQGLDEVALSTTIDFATDVMSQYTIVAIARPNPRARNDLRVLKGDNVARYKVLVELGFASTASEWKTLFEGAAKAAAELASGLDVHIQERLDEFNSTEQEKPY